MVGWNLYLAPTKTMIRHDSDQEMQEIKQESRAVVGKPRDASV